jgi:hypothetical protein
MKKTLLWVAALAGTVLFCSCVKGTSEPEPDPLPEPDPPPALVGKSLAGTTWKSRFEDNGDWMEEKLVFTATNATYTETNSAGNDMNFTGTYTYDPPTVVITSNSWNFPPPTGVLKAPGDIHHTGKVEESTLTIGIQVYDMVGIVELQKQ